MSADIWGSVTLFLGVLMVVFGLSAQVVKNYKEKRSGQPLLLAALALGVNFSRAGYAVTIKAWYILIPDIVGIVLFIVIISQHFYYKEH